MSALLESGKPPTTRVRRRISLFNHSIMLFYSSRLSFSCGGRWKTAVFAGRSRWWSDLWCNYGATRAAIWFGKVFASRNLVAGGG